MSEFGRGFLVILEFGMRGLDDMHYNTWTWLIESDFRYYEHYGLMLICKYSLLLPVCVLWKDMNGF